MGSGEQASEPPPAQDPTLACPQCGELNRPGSRFCRACGGAIEAEVNQSAVHESGHARRGRIGAIASNRWAILGVAAVAVVVAGGLLAWHFGLWGQISPQPTAAVSAGPAGTPEALGGMVVWDPTQGDPKTYLVDGYTLVLSSARTAGGSVPQLRVTAPDGRSFVVQGQAGVGSPAANFGVSHIDSALPGDQVLLATYTGGAHCCDEVVVLELAPEGWRSVKVGDFQGDTLGNFPKDVDGDGVPDFVMEDDRFAYAFTDFADSYMPPQILNVVNGAVVDVSDQPKYASLFRKDLKQTRAACLKHSNGGCAAFVADASRLGLHDWAWSLMLANYDSTTTWTWPTHCMVSAPSGACPSDQQQTFNNMPDALQAFLIDSGYVSAPQSTADSNPAGPSFDCAAVTSAIIRLICNTPSLAEQDRELSAAYSAAMARVPDPVRLRNEQRLWIARRAAMPVDVNALTDLYTSRIQELQAEGTTN